MTTPVNSARTRASPSSRPFPSHCWQHSSSQCPDPGLILEDKLSGTCHSTHYWPQQEETYLASPTGSDTTTSARGRKDSSPPSNSSANEKSLHLKLSVSSNGHFVYSSPSKSITEFLSFVSVGLPVHRIVILCCSWINLFCWRNVWLSICQKSTDIWKGRQNFPHIQKRAGWKP